ncbi:unnamed protein product [Linum trigynum]|uniref:Uncharacterized protein n=1 Tax=Linum trigynum TaxID=586398 RepID=A0AAV2GHZ4_9ROSI
MGSTYVELSVEELTKILKLKLEEFIQKDESDLKGRLRHINHLAASTLTPSAAVEMDLGLVEGSSPIMAAISILQQP